MIISRICLYTSAYALCLVLSAAMPVRAEEWRESLTFMDFVKVPKGCFKMGCIDPSWGCAPDELPAHEVCVEEFWLGKYEVTQAQWKLIMHSNPSKLTKGSNYPVENVSYTDVREFIRKLNDAQKKKDRFRLPTEAEWEYACRSAGKPEKYSGGENLSKLGWFYANSDNSTHPVGTLEPNGLGMHDMSGNVWEWTEDAYNENAYGLKPGESKKPDGKKADGKKQDAKPATDAGKDKADKPKPAEANPKLGKEEPRKVFRGGSWYGISAFARCSARYYGYLPDYRRNDLGFRLVRMK